MATVTRAAIRQEIGQRLGGYVSGTATGGTTTTLVASTDVEFIGDSNTPSADTYEDRWLLVTSGGNATAIRRVAASGYAPNTGTLTIPTNLAWSTAILTGVTFEVHGYISPARIHECINRAVRKLYHRYTFPVTMVTDGTMDEDSTTASWTASNANIEKTTTAAQIITGKRAMQVQTTSANGYAQTLAIPVEEKAGYYCETSFKGVGAGITPKLVAWDVTSGVEIASGTWAIGGDGSIGFGFTTPTACRGVYLRLQVVETASTMRFDNLILLKNGRRTYDLPSFVLNPDAELIEVWNSVGGTRPYNRDWERRIEWEPFSDATGATPFALRLGAPTSNGPVYVEMRRRFDALSADADTIAADLDWVATAGLVEVYRILRNSQPNDETKFWTARHQEALTELRFKNARFQPQVPERKRAGITVV